MTGFVSSNDGIIVGRITPTKVLSATIKSEGTLRAIVAIPEIVSAPIPSNYGLITWDGSVLTVS